jgi:hypothetical protein
MFTPDKIIEIFCMADDFCKEFDLEAQKHQIQTLDKKKYHIQTIFTLFLFYFFRRTQVNK